MKGKLEIFSFTLFLILQISDLTASQKNAEFHIRFRDPVVNHAEILDQWMKLQIRLMSQTQANFNGPFIRIYAYSGIAAYAAIYPLIEKKSPNKFLLEKLNDFPALPELKSTKLYGPASINAALAYMNKVMFPMASRKNKLYIDSLENSLEKILANQTDEETLKNSIEFGRKTALIIFHWAETDGYKNGNDAYSAPSGRGNWQPTAPSFANAVAPYWGRLRTIVPGSITNTEPPPPPEYSEDSTSFFYSMVKQVYDYSNKISPAQKEIAIYWKDINPGVTAPGHWLNILRQLMISENTSLEKSAFAYALTGIALNDTWISSWKTRYTYNLLRPVTYVQTVMGQKDWVPAIPTPPHPEYPGGHAALSSSVAEVLTAIFGDHYLFTDRTYEYIGYPARTYPDFRSIANEAAISKVYGGIHYLLSVDVGLDQGRKVAENVLRSLSKR